VVFTHKDHFASLVRSKHWSVVTDDGTGSTIIGTST